mgnify:CR=1 FL=1
MLNSRIAIGSVQFGLPYGVANTSSKEVSSLEISEILTYAQSAGIKTIDTAISYGKSESKLGDYGVNDYEIITKLPTLPEKCENVNSWVSGQLNESLSRLKLSRVYGLLLHNPEDLSGPKGDELWAAMQLLKKNKLVNKIGYSIYRPEDLDTYYHLFFPDIVQSPYSILDRRLASSGWLDELFNAQTEIHVRSIFLQGLLLMSKNKRPGKFDKWLSVFDKLELWLKDNGLSAMQASISFAMQDPRITKVILGVENLKQLKEIVSNIKSTTRDFPIDLSVQDIDIDLIDPSKWNLL